MLNNLSLARAQIALDQIRGAVATNSLDKIVFATASEADTPAAAAIAIQQTSEANDACDTATIIHAGWLSPSSEANANEIIPALLTTFDREMSRRGVHFLQWATDATEANATHASDAIDDHRDSAVRSVSRWCEGFGFQMIGTLDYLGGDVPPATAKASTPSDLAPLRITPIAWDQPSEFQRFANLVEETYAETLDCPLLAKFRSAEQTLRGYQTSAAFDPSLWFCASEGSSQSIGCVVLACHRPSTTPDAQDTSSVIEIVYMGLVPEARGMGRGKGLMERALEAARSAGAARIILAVDQQNAPARAIYDRAGLQPMLSETVWVKSLKPESAVAN